MKYLFTPLLLLCVFSLNAQASYEIELKSTVGSRHQLPFRLTAVEDLTQTGGVIGTVHTSLLNLPKDARLRYGTEQALLRIAAPGDSRSVDDLPEATVSLIQFKISETILAMKEIGRVEMAATLTVQTPDGPRHYGPASYEFSKGGMSDVTKKHDDRISTAFDEVLVALAAAYRAGATIEGVVPQYHPLDDDIPDGVYRSEIDFLLSRTAPDITLIPKNTKIIGTIGGVEFHRVHFLRGDGVKAKDVDQIYGYHWNGYDFVLVKNRFYSVERLDNGRVAALLPSDLNRVVGENAIIGYAIGGAIGAAIGGATDQSNALIEYDLNLENGKFEAVREQHQSAVAEVPKAAEVADTIIYLVNISDADRGPITLQLPNRTIELSAGYGVELNSACTITFESEGKQTVGKAEFFGSRTKEVFSLKRRKNGKVAMDWVHTSDRKKILSEIRWIESSDEPEMKE